MLQQDGSSYFLLQQKPFFLEQLKPEADHPGVGGWIQFFDANFLSERKVPISTLSLHWRCTVEFMHGAVFCPSRRCFLFGFKFLLRNDRITVRDISERLVCTRTMSSLNRSYHKGTTSKTPHTYHSFSLCRMQVVCLPKSKSGHLFA